MTHTEQKINRIWFEIKRAKKDSEAVQRKIKLYTGDKRSNYYKALYLEKKKYFGRLQGLGDAYEIMTGR